MDEGSRAILPMALSGALMRLGLICGLFLASTTVAVADDWRLLKTSQYTVISRLNETATLSWAHEYDQFIASTSSVLKVDPRALTPLTVILFGSDKAFAPYKPMRENGKTVGGVAGLFIRRPTYALIGMPGMVADAETRSTIYHEGVHWLLSSEPTRHPAWFSEGFAELFSTFERQGSKVNWAKPIVNHLYNLNSRVDMPLRDLLGASSALHDSNSHTGLFYSAAWAFTHFMLMSKDPKRREQLVRYLSVYRTKSTDATILEVFGDGFTQLERDFQNYVGTQRSFGYMIESAKPVPALPKSTAAPMAEVEAALGLFALASGNTPRARAHAKAALAADSKSARAYELNAYLADGDADTSAVFAHAASAVQFESRDPQMYAMLAEFAQSPRQKASNFERAINLNPRLPHLYGGLVNALMEMDEPTESDAKFLDLGLSALPQEDFIRVGAAQVAHKRGQHSVALEHLKVAMREGSSLDGSDRQFAESILRGWQTEEMHEQLRAAIAQRRYVEGIAILERYREPLKGDPMMERFIEDTLRELRALQAPAKKPAKGR
jgi:Tfp pilus assembly protein PilF